MERRESRDDDGFVVLAVDDDEAERMMLTELLDAHPLVTAVRQADGAAAALRELSVTPSPDVVFTDIDMPGVDGLELARTILERAASPLLVFVTDFDDRAVDAYELGAVDYLLKPLRPERLDLAVHRVLARRATRPLALPPPDELLAVELAGTTTLVPRSDVRFVEARGDYARLHTDTATHLVRVSLATLADRWREAGWVRIHRSYLVATDRVTVMELGGMGHVVRLGRGRDAVELPVSRRHVREVKARLGC